MKRTATPREAYLQYLDGKRSFDSVLDITEEWAAEVRRNALAPAPEVVAAEEAEARRRFERSRVRPLWEAYIQATHGKRSIESVFDLAEHMRDFVRYRAEPGADGREPSPVEDAYQRVLGGELPLDDMLAIADGYFSPPTGGEPAMGERG